MRPAWARRAAERETVKEGNGTLRTVRDAHHSRVKEDVIGACNRLGRGR